MGKPNLKIAGEPPPPRTPEREQLAAAQQRHAEAVERLAAVQAARERTQQARRDAKEAIAKAEAAVEQAKIDAAAHLTAVVLGNAGPAPISVKAARDNVVAAQDALDAASSAAAALANHEEEAERGLMLADMALDKHFEAAVKADPAVRQLVADFEAASKTYAELRQAMNVVRRERMPDTPGSWDSVRNWSELPTAVAWKAAIEALRADADAELPTN